MTIKVTNLPAQVTHVDLTELFASYGAVEAVEIFETENTATVALAAGEEQAIQALNGQAWREITLALELDDDATGRGPHDPP